MRTSCNKRLIGRASAMFILASIVLLSIPWLPVARSTAQAALAAVPTPIFSDKISGFELYQKGVFWWHTLSIHGCPSGEFSNQASIKLRGIFSAPEKILEDKRCPVLLNGGNVVGDSLYLYYFEDEQLVRKAVSAAASDPTTPLTQAPRLPSPYNETLAIDSAGRLYWSTNNNGVLTIWRMKADNSEAPTVFTSLNTAGGGISRMMTYHYNAVDGIAFIANGNLWRYNNNVASPLLLGSNVRDFWARVSQVGAFSTVTFYAARDTGLFRITNTGNSTQIYTPSTNNPTTIDSVTADDQNIYLVEGIYGCLPGQFCPEPTRSLYRRALSAADNVSWDLMVAQEGGTNLRSDGQYLYFKTGSAYSTINELKKVATNVPPVQIAIKADALEVVQTIQSIVMDIPLIANKPTYARGYAHALINTSGNDQLRPSAVLYGKLNGQDLPGSPLSPINSPFIDTTSNLGALRGDLQHSFLFELPQSWVQDKFAGPVPSVLDLRMVVNPHAGIPETEPNPQINNSISLIQRARIYHKGQPCLVTIRVWVKGQPFPAGLGPIYERARALMPVEDFRIFDYANVSGENIFYLSDGGEPYDDMTSDDSEILGKLKWMWLANLTDPPSGCGDQTFYLGLVPPNVEWHFNSGNGYVGGVTHRNERYLLVRMRTDSGAVPWSTAVGGYFLAHELGHDYGRRHIACGNFPDDQSNFDSNAPFDNCHLSFAAVDSPITHFGFDPLTLSVIGPTVAADIMSYSSPKWSSVNYYNYLFDRTVFDNDPSAALAASTEIAPQAGPALLMGGSVAADESSASFRHFYILPEGVAPAARLAGAIVPAHSGEVVSYTLRLLDGAGATLAESTLPADADESHEGGAEPRQFSGLVPYNAKTRRIQLLHDGALLAERTVSAGLPSLSLGQPAIDASAHRVELSWNASDPDGDTLLALLQYSADGVRWRTLLADYRYSSATLDLGALPGGAQARLRLLVSDGVNTAVAASAPFAVPRHPPVPQLSGVGEGQRVPFGQALRLNAIAYDAEEGDLDGDRLSWSVTGPSTASGTGNELALRDLAPGSYSVTVSATDSDGQVAAASRAFEVGPLAVAAGATPTLDGGCDDAGYDGAALVHLPQAGRAAIAARLIHAGGSLYACFGELPYGSTVPALAGLRVDLNASGDARAQTDDIGFFVGDDGIPLETIGDGADMPPTTAPRPGFSAAVVRGDSAWSAELRIAEELIGGWDHAARLMLSAGAASATSDDAAWPPAAKHAQPASWAAAYFGAPPAGPNRAPQADAGLATTYHPSAPLTIYLDGTNSADPDGQTLNYAWSQLAGPRVTLNDPATATPSFSVGPVSAPTVLRFQLTVSDGHASSNPDEVEITLLPARPSMGGLHKVYLPLVVK